MANYPRSYIYFASLLEASGIQGATTLWTSLRYLLCIRIYPARSQVAWQDVTIYLVYSWTLGRDSRLNEDTGTPPVHWLGYH